eukprot:6923908-Prymnesium_polylepis.1
MVSPRLPPSATEWKRPSFSHAIRFCRTQRRMMQAAFKGGMRTAGGPGRAANYMSRSRSAPPAGRSAASCRALSPQPGAVARQHRAQGGMRLRASTSRRRCQART